MPDGQAPRKAWRRADVAGTWRGGDPHAFVSVGGTGGDFSDLRTGPGGCAVTSLLCRVAKDAIVKRVHLRVHPTRCSGSTRAASRPRAKRAGLRRVPSSTSPGASPPAARRAMTASILVVDDQPSM